MLKTTFSDQLLTSLASSAPFILDQPTRVELGKLTEDELYHLQKLILDHCADPECRLTGYMAIPTRDTSYRRGSECACSFGRLTSCMSRPENSKFPLPVREPSVVQVHLGLVLGESLPLQTHQPAELLRSLAFATPVVTVVDPRYYEEDIDASLTIAKNLGVIFYVSGGKPVSLDLVKLRTSGVVVEINGEIEALGAGASPFNDPLYSLAEFLEKRLHPGGVLDAGSMILSGPLAPHVTVKAGDVVNVRCQHMGSVSFVLEA
ncbi:hypothetical protein [Haliea atlantica]